MTVLRNNLDEATERLRDTKFQLFAVTKENEALKNEKQSVDAVVSERQKAEAERNEKEVRRLRRKVESLEEERREAERLHERVAVLDTEARARQDVITTLEGKLAAQTDQLRRVEQDLARTSSSSKTTDEDRKVFLSRFTFVSCFHLSALDGASLRMTDCFWFVALARV